jgi:alkylation response protein AidB-like acyl-CoA dehydrogenase
MHNLQLSEDQDLIVDTVRKFVADVVAPSTLERDEHRTTMRAEFDGLGELGLFGLLVGEAAGGAGMGFVPFAAALETVGEHSSSLARLWIGQVQCALALETGSGPGLDAVVGGAELAAFIGPEHGLRWEGGALHGTAKMVPGATAAARFVVAATDAGKPVLLTVTAATGKAHRSLGLASAGCGLVSFAEAKATVVATGDVAAQALARAQLAAWIGVAATAIGGGQASIAAARRHAGERIAFGKPLLAQEAVVRKLVDCKHKVDGARQLVWHAARLQDLGQDATEAALQARLASVEAMVVAADEAIQIHGGFGYTVEYHVERHYRDAKTLEVLDGGADAMRNRLAARQFA